MSFAFVKSGAINQYPIGLIEIQRRFPNTSFPKPLEVADLTSFGVVNVADTDQPAFNTETQRLEEGTPALVDGTWQQVWNVIELTADELQAIADRNAASVRAVRNQKLADTDWTQLADSSAPATVWGTYRQALRDIPAQSGFPNSVTWPTEPS